MLLFTSLSAAVYSASAFDLVALVWLVFSAVFLSFLVSNLWMVSAEIHSLCLAFFLPRTSSHASRQSFLLSSHCVSRSVSLSSISPCSRWSLSELLIWNAFFVSLFLSRPKFYLVRVLLLASVYFFSRSLTAVTTR